MSISNMTIKAADELKYTLSSLSLFIPCSVRCLSLTSMSRTIISVLIIATLIATSVSFSTSYSPSDTMSNKEAVTLGFIGFGTIAEAIANGLLIQTEHPIDKVYISRRSESKSAALASKFSEKVVVCDDNQEIVDGCDTLFLCVLPDQEEEVLKSLQISHDTTLISLVSTSKLNALIQNSGLPAEKVYKMICLPAVAELEGTPLLVPRANSDLHGLLSTLGGGTCIQCENEDMMEVIMVTTCSMGPVYGLMRTNRDFLIKKGVSIKDANNVVARQYFAITKDALARSEVDSEDSLDKLISEQTPGGLNEQTLRNLEGVGFLKSYEESLEAILGRIQGQTDGSMAALSKK